MKRFLPIVSIVILLVGFFASHASAAEEKWEYQEPMPFSRIGAGIVQLDGKVYVIGGYNNGASDNVDVFDPQANTWTSKKKMPTPRSVFSIEVVNGKIYVIGGYSSDPNTSSAPYYNKVEIYDPAADTWTSGADVPQKIGWTASASYNNKIYIFGGLDSSSGGMGSVSEYDTVTNTWAVKKSLPGPVHAASAVTYNGKIYVIGGGFGSETYKIVQQYDPATNTWSIKKDALTTRDAAQAIVYNNKIYVIGGYNGHAVATVEVYDPETDTWKGIASLNKERWGFGSVILNDSIYVFGGLTNTVEKLSTATTPEPTPTTTPEPTQTPSPTVTPSPTPEQPTGKRAILVVTMNTGLEKEFDLSMAEVNAFISWYESKQAGTGTASYAIDKHDNNKGPFTSRKDYVIFDKILTFSVDEYSA